MHSAKTDNPASHISSFRHHVDLKYIENCYLCVCAVPFWALTFDQNSYKVMRKTELKIIRK